MSMTTAIPKEWALSIRDFNSSGVPKAFDPNDIDGNENDANKIFDREKTKELDRIVLSNTPLSGGNLNNVLTYTEQT